MVYGGLDIGQAVLPLAAGWLMDHGQTRALWLLLAANLGYIVPGQLAQPHQHADDDRPAAAGHHGTPMLAG